MVIKSTELCWIVVADLKRAVEFYTKTLGLTLVSLAEEFGWAELHGQDGGTRLGLAAVSQNNPMQPGSNAVMTFVVEDMESAKKEFQAKGLKLVGEVMEVPGHVKLQDFVNEF